MKAKEFLTKLGVAATLSVVSLLGGVSVCSAYNPNSVPSYCQRSSPWAGDTLGYGPGTLGIWGCFVTCIGDETQFFNGGNWDPRTMNNWLKARGDFSGNLVIPSRAPGYLGWNNYSRSAADLNHINGLLDAGYLVIAETRWPTNRSLTHYVLLTGHSGTTYSISDPWYGDRVTFQSRYGDPGRWIYSIYIFGRTYSI